MAPDIMVTDGIIGMDQVMVIMVGDGTTITMDITIIIRPIITDIMLTTMEREEIPTEVREIMKLGTIFPEQEIQIIIPREETKLIPQDLGLLRQDPRLQLQEIIHPEAKLLHLEHTPPEAKHLLRETIHQQEQKRLYLELTHLEAKHHPQEVTLQVQAQTKIPVAEDQAVEAGDNLNKQEFTYVLA
jgi:hypothetical protein